MNKSQNFHPFSTDRSWYEEYWYKPRPPAKESRWLRATIAMLRHRPKLPHLRPNAVASLRRAISNVG